MEWEHLFPIIYELKKRPWKVIQYFGLPAFGAMFSFFVMFVFLHQGTYFYVHEMTEVEQWYKYRPHAPKINQEKWPHLSVGSNTSDVSFGSMNDVVESMVHWENIPIGSLDKLAALFPLFFITFAFLRCRLRVWTRVMICHAFLAIGKGLLGMITTVPDSIGWHNCQERLTEKNVLWFQQEHSFWDILGREIEGAMSLHMTRFCADMVYSGHTWSVTLYALGIYNLADDETEDFVMDGKGYLKSRNLLLFLVASLAVAEQGYEVYCVLINRFHYTLDVLLAIVLSMLFFTNGVIARWSKKWGLNSTLNCPCAPTGIVGAKQDLKGFIFVNIETLLPLGSIMVPPAHYEHLYSDNRIKEIYHAIGEDGFPMVNDKEAASKIAQRWGEDQNWEDNPALGRLSKFLKLDDVVDFEIP